MSTTTTKLIELPDVAELLAPFDEASHSVAGRNWMVRPSPG
jgi:hypothetical protein